MLTNFFGKSKPINFILLGIFLFLGYFYHTVIKIAQTDSFFYFQKQTILFLIIIFSMLLLNFIVKKNYLAYNTTYTVFFFTSYLLLVPQFFDQTELILSNLFLLLAFRRILSLSSDKNREKKILDASIWITLAALFYFWNLLFFIVLFVAIIQQRSKNYKLIFIPFVGFFAVITLITTYEVIVNNSMNWYLTIDKEYELFFQVYDTPRLLASILIIIGFITITLCYRLIYFSEVRIKEKSKTTLLILILITAVITVLFYPDKSGGEILYVLAPLAIFSANFIEKLETLWIKEMILVLLFVSPLIISFI